MPSDQSNEASRLAASIGCELSDDIGLLAADIAAEVVNAFSTLHPEVLMNREQWADLVEMIEREVEGMCGPVEAIRDGTAPSAADLLSNV